jgi:hypothetical protein
MIVSRKILSKTLWLVCKNSEETLWNENLLLYGNILLLINWLCNSLQQNNATVYDMCAVAEVTYVYCDIKNINAQYNVVKKFNYHMITIMMAPLLFETLIYIFILQ